MKEEGKKTMASNTIFGKPFVARKSKEVAYATIDNLANTPQHWCNRQISNFYEEDGDGLEIIKENLDVEILECDKTNDGKVKNDKMVMVPFRVLSQNKNHQKLTTNLQVTMTTPDANKRISLY